LENSKIAICRVGMLVHSYYLTDARVRRQAEFLAAQGYDVHVICCADSTSSKKGNEHRYQVVNGVHFYLLSLKKKRGNVLRYIFEYLAMTIMGGVKLVALTLKKKFDVVHIHNMPDFMVIAGLIPKLLGAKLLLDVHDPMSELFQENYYIGNSHPLIRLIKLQEKLSYRLVDRLLTVSHTMAENVSKKSGRAQDQIGVIHNFPDLSLFPIRNDERKWPGNKNELICLYAGTVTEHYRLDVAVRAIAIVARTIPGIKLQILGIGNRLQKVLDLARQLHIEDKVEHLKLVPLDKVKSIMANADVGISPHQSGVFGDLYFSTKIIEFMTQGLPVISSRTKTIEQHLSDECVFYFNSGDEEDLAKQIILLYNNKDLVAKKINNAKKILPRLSWQAECQHLSSFYSELRRWGG